MIIDGNAILTELVSKNWMPLLIVFAVLKAFFPNSKILNAIGEAISSRFPIFKGK